MSFGKDVARTVAGDFGDDEGRRELGEALVRVTEERDEARGQREAATWLHAQAMELIGEIEAERDEARDEVVRLGRNLEELDSRLRAAADAHQEDAARLLGEIERLRTIIGESGAAEAGEGEL